MSSTSPDPAATMIRREERLTVSTQRLATERVRVERVIVTEQRTLTVDVRREELRITREPLPEGSLIPAGKAAIETEPLVMVLHEEQIAIAKTVIPVERVTITTETVIQDQQVTADLGREVVDVLTTDTLYTEGSPMSDTTGNLGTDRTIPNTPDGIAVGHDPDGSHFNPEEVDATTPGDTDALPAGSGTDAESSIKADDDSDTASGGDTD